MNRNRDLTVELAHFLSKRISLILLLGGCFALLSCSKEPDAQKSSKTNPQDAVKTVVQLAGEGRIKYFRVYYMGWEDPTIPVSEKELIAGRYDCETVFRHGWGIALSMKGLFEEFPFRDAKVERLDCRISFVFYETEDTEILRLTLARNSGIILINGTPFHATRELTNALTRNVPHVFHATYDELWPELAGKTKGEE